MNWKTAIIITFIGIMVLAGSSPAFSQEKPKEWTSVDLNTLDCRTYLKMSGEERQSTVAFYHGFVSGMKKEMTVNVPAMAEISDKVLDQCIDKPSEVLLKIFQENRK
jgi:hypothetical protein